MARLTRVERQALTVAELLAAAEVEFSARGYSAVTVDAIADRAGYTRGAVYGNFPTGKPDLFLQVAEARAARYVDEINAALATADAAEIADVYLGVRARALNTPGWGRALVEFGLVAAGDESLRERFAALRRATVDRVGSGFEALGPQASFDATDLATVVVALEVGLDLLRWVDPGLVPDDDEYCVIERPGRFHVTGACTSGPVTNARVSRLCCTSGGPSHRECNARGDVSRRRAGRCRRCEFRSARRAR